ncbi:hypothetical protein M378DRAFT_182577 [Amanita muscaria Koide BX008]|uniref:Alpha-type protein kinase domain-containing protein n=1 Tax=Amanita muscaria (strain Koide BX008) TaxID=946122 RepID=A0A0C2VZR7_AMAMK|nr:hypothetical protein M378DRAFT_182577 [Amanita muscaria Koide BX008]
MSLPAISDYEPIFTSTTNVQSECERCHVNLPKADLYFMRSFIPGKKGRFLCKDCHDYYRQKPGTVRRPGGSGIAAPRNGTISGIDITAIHQQVGAAQRMEGTSQIKAIGSIMGAPLLQASLAISPVAGPIISTPYRHRQPIVPPFPVNWELSKPGYQEAHIFYNDMEKTRVASEVIVVKAWLAYRAPERRKETVVNDVFEALQNIPVHIGARDLKRVIYTMILPHFLAWSKGLPINIDECELRNKQWVELIPRHPEADVDVIADKFIDKGRKKNGAPVFNPRQGIDLYLVIGHLKVQQILSHVEQLSEANQVATKGQKRKRSSSSVQPAREVSQQPATPSKMPQRLVQARSPEAKRVRQALEIQSAPGKRRIASLFNTKTIECNIFIRPTIDDFSEIVKNPATFLEPWKFRRVRATLSYNSTTKPKKGTFKSSVEGFSSVTLFQQDSLQICIKQGICQNPGSKPTRYDTWEEARILSVEINCIGWAQALLDLVYNFVAAALPACGEPPLPVPQMRFVGAGLAVTTSTEGQTTYLVEEFIDPVTEGPFTKYLNNDSPEPFRFPDPALNTRALFLSFSQHVQYMKTKCLVFVSDYQANFGVGGLTLLTDPQVITSL